jgi:lantibiotic modifying enzyme
MKVFTLHRHRHHYKSIVSWCHGVITTFVSIRTLRTLITAEWEDRLPHG